MSELLEYGRMTALKTRNIFTKYKYVDSLALILASFVEKDNVYFVSVKYLKTRSTYTFLSYCNVIL